jgi:hypothetical protein
MEDGAVATLGGNMQHRLRFTLSFAIGATLIAAVAAGCGSSDSNSTSTAPLSKASYLAKGNAICKAGQQKQDAAQQALGQNPTQAQLTAYATATVIPNIQSQIDQVKALGAPSGDEATVSNFLGLAQADLNTVKSDPTILFTRKIDPFSDFAKVAHPYGLTACAANG